MPQHPRIALVDIARTIALCAMAVFHFAYDLELFGFAPRGMMVQPEWVWFARCIAGSFIFLSGVSLVLGAPFVRDKYLRRLVMIGVAASLVTIGTYAALGGAFVRFGMLHLLFAASILGLPFLRAPYWASLALGACILALPLTGAWPFLNGTIWLWLGATVQPLPHMVDYVPILPWFGMFLIGIGVAGAITRLDGWTALSRMPRADSRLARLASWPGRHSLALYLIHQPVLLTLVALARWIAG